MCMVDDAETWSVYRNEVRRSAKSHRCTECSRVIEKGETYEYATGLLDGRWDLFKTCEHCMAARAWLSAVCNGWLFGEVLEDLHEHWLSEYTLQSFWLARTIVRMRKGWRRSDGSLYPVSAPRPGIEYPLFVSARPARHYDYAGEVDNSEEAQIERAEMRLLLNTIKRIWWGEWTVVQYQRELDWAKRKLEQKAT